MDDRLRVLERAARSSPGDREAAWAFVRALEQSGDVGSAWIERRRLARAGDDLALRELSSAPRAATRLELGPTRTLDLTHGDVLTDGQSLFLLEREVLRAFDARTLEPTWSAAASGNDTGALWGPYLVHAGPGDGVLMVRARADGTEVASLAVDASWDIGSILATSDHVVVVFDRTDDDRPDNMKVVDVAHAAPAVAGVRVWPEARMTGSPIVVRDLLLQWTPRGSTSARELASSQVRWTHVGSPLCADSRDVFTKPSAGRSFEVACLDPVTGKQRWAHAVPAHSDMRWALGPDLLVIALTSQNRRGHDLEVRAIERETGGARWSVSDVDPRPFTDVAVAHDGVYVACGGTWSSERGRGLDVCKIHALDARTGDRKIACEVLPDGSGLDGPYVRPSLLPVNGGVLVMIKGPRRTWLARLGED